MNWVILLIKVIVGIIVIAPILWLVGRELVGKEKAKFTDAIWIVALGLIIGDVLGAFIYGLGLIIGAVISLIIWLALVKHFFDCGWLKAFLIAILAFIILIILAIVLGILIGIVGILALLGSGSSIPGISL